MKIAFIVNIFPSLSEAFILNQITTLIDMGYEVDIYSKIKPNQSKLHPDVDEYNLLDRTYYFTSMPASKLKRLILGLRLFIFNYHRNFIAIMNSLNFVKFGKNALSLNNLYLMEPFLPRSLYDIIHCHFGPNGNLVILLKKLGVLQGKIITSFHGYDCNLYVRSHGKDVYNELFRFGDLFTVNSNFTKERIIQIGCVDDKILHLPVGLSLERFTLKDYALPKRDSTVKILTVSRLIEKKGLEYSIKAVAQLMQRFSAIEYRIIGDGPLKTELEDLVSDLGIYHSVKFLGWREHSEIIEFYKESDIFLLSSVTANSGDEEGQGLVLQEAQAIGLPVVSTLHNGIPEGVLNGQTGFLVPERDVDALTERLIYLIEHPELWPQMGMAGRKFVEDSRFIRFKK